MRIIIVFMCFFCLVSVAHAVKIGVLTEILKPDAIEGSADKLYVVEGSKYFVYALKDLKLIAKFGKKGEGPGELKESFMFPNSITVLRNKLILEGLDKVLFFSNTYKLLKEVRKKGMQFKISPLDKKFVGIRVLPTGKDRSIMSLALMDNGLKLIKELYQQEIPDKEKEVLLVTDSIHYSIYKDKIYVEESDKGFFIEVFDSNGERLLEIKKNIANPKVMEGQRNALLENFKEDGLVIAMAKRSGGWDNFKKTLNFTPFDTFPSIKDIIVTDNRIYVSTYKTKAGKTEYIIMDLKGNIIGTPYLPTPKNSSFTAQALGRENRFFSIANNKYYYLVENEKTEEWELHAEIIK